MGDRDIYLKKLYSFDRKFSCFFFFFSTNSIFESNSANQYFRSAGRKQQRSLFERRLAKYNPTDCRYLRMLFFFFLIIIIITYDSNRRQIVLNYRKGGYSFVLRLYFSISKENSVPACKDTRGTCRAKWYKSTYSYSTISILREKLSVREQLVERNDGYYERGRGKKEKRKKEKYSSWRVLQARSPRSNTAKLLYVR